MLDLRLEPWQGDMYGTWFHPLRQLPLESDMHKTALARGATGAFAALMLASLVVPNTATASTTAAPSVKQAGVELQGKAPSYTVNKPAPYRKGQRVTVTFRHFPKNKTLLIAVCRARTDLSRGAEAVGDCAPFAGPSSEFATSNGKGNGKGKVTILRGKLHAANWPGYRCGNKKKNRCVLVVSDLSAKHVVKKKLTYT